MDELLEKLSDYIEAEHLTLAGFKQTLADAEEAATSDWETTFVADMCGKFEKYGENMFLSEKQLKRLEKIGSGE